MATQKAEYIRGLGASLPNSQMAVERGLTAEASFGMGKELLLTLSVAVTKP